MHFPFTINVCIVGRDGFTTTLVEEEPNTNLHQVMQSATSTFHEIITPPEEEAPMYIPAAPVYQPPMEISPVPSPNSAGKKASRAQREDAIEYCHFAIAALEHKVYSYYYLISYTNIVLPTQQYLPIHISLLYTYLSSCPCLHK